MLFPTVFAALVATVAAARDRSTFAVLRHYGSGPLMDCRIDPIVQPGGPSGHVHTFMGANNLGFNTTGQDLRRSSCTTALPKADLSAYWFPKLYFKDPSTGKLEPVPFYYMNVYYFFDATNDNLKSFPLGLKFISGSPQIRTPPAKTGAQNLDPNKGPLNPARITCPRGNFNPPSWPAGSDGSMAGIGDPTNTGSGIGFPFQDCDGLYSPMRVDVHFPSCYNPAAGLENQKSNSAFPVEVAGGKRDCPQGWIHVPHLFFETYWDTHKFLPRFSNLLGKESPFVFSNGDVTGFSAHADFLAGWDETALQQIIDSNCDAGHAGIHTCPGLIGGVNPTSGSCKATCPVNEDVNGPFDKLPGNNPLSGWKYGAGTVGGTGSTNPAPPNPPPNTVAATPTTLVPTTKATTTTPAFTPTSGAGGISGFSYVGCYKDSSARTLTGETFVNLGQVSSTGCVNHCASKGFSIAGTEYGGECFCGNSLTKIEKLSEDKCGMACKGAPNEKCGGSWALSVYTKGGVVPGAAKRHIHDHFAHHRRGHSHN